MIKDLHDQRKNYRLGTLLESEVPLDPIQLFKVWFDQAQINDGVIEANAMSLTTVGNDGFPRNRIVLLKELYNSSLIFYTNYHSIKADHINNNPKACLHFFWPALEKQVIIKCTVNKLEVEKSKAYFKSRPRASQIGAWVSNQSSPIDNRSTLEEKKIEIQNKFLGQNIPMPSHWGGYCCTPVLFEFWQGREGRLHDRIEYSAAQDGWNIQRLQP